MQTLDGVENILVLDGGSAWLVGKLWCEVVALNCVLWV